VNLLVKRSLWVYHVNTGACNGCDIEFFAALCPRYDPERFGVKLVESPRHADAFVVTGPVTLQALPRVVEAFRVGRPKIVIAIGSCACGGGIWHDSAAVLGGVQPLLEILEKEGIEKPEKIIWVPGCPPRPHAIAYSIAATLDHIEKARGLKKLKQTPTTTH